MASWEKSKSTGGKSSDNGNAKKKPFPRSIYDSSESEDEMDEPKEEILKGAPWKNFDINLLKDRDTSAIGRGYTILNRLPRDRRVGVGRSFEERNDITASIRAISNIDWSNYAIEQRFKPVQERPKKQQEEDASKPTKEK